MFHMLPHYFSSEEDFSYYFISCMFLRSGLRVESDFSCCRVLPLQFYLVFTFSFRNCWVFQQSQNVKGRVYVSVNFGSAHSVWCWNICNPTDRLSAWKTFSFDEKFISWKSFWARFSVIYMMIQMKMSVLIAVRYGKMRLASSLSPACNFSIHFLWQTQSIY